MRKHVAQKNLHNNRRFMRSVAEGKARDYFKAWINVQRKKSIVPKEERGSDS